MTGRLLTGRQVADRLGVSTKTVLRWALDGQLPSIRLSSRAIRFPEDALDAWLMERTAPTQGGVNDPAGRRPPASLVAVNDPTHKDPPWPDS